MSNFVLDSSVTVSWAFEDENSPYAAAILECLTGHETIAPSLWTLEVVNALLAAERRDRISPSQVTVFLRYLRALPIRVEAIADTASAAPLAELARRHDLTAYDAEYLSLAIRENLPIATLDRQLIGAAERAGVPCFSP